MTTPITPMRLRPVDLERVRRLRDRYQLDSDTDAVRLALALALQQNIVMAELKIKA